MAGLLSLSSGEDWYAVRSQPRKEALAQLHLDRQGFKTFFPKIAAGPKTHRRCRPGAGPQTAPLFANYLFVRAGGRAGDWRSINGTIGVARLVQFGAQPAPVPKGFVEGLVAHSGDSGVVELDFELAPGARVQVVGGPFDGHIGELRHTTPDGRVAVLMNVMSRSMDVVVPRGALISAA